MVLLGIITAKAQSAYTPEKVLWVCPEDTSIKITYRLNNYQNSIEINGPFNMDTSKINIFGTLKISNGDFNPSKQATSQQISDMVLKSKSNTEPANQPKQTTDLKINDRYYSINISYYNTNTKPTVTFEGYLFYKTKKVSTPTLEPKKPIPTLGDRG